MADIPRFESMFRTRAARDTTSAGQRPGQEHDRFSMLADVLSVVASASLACLLFVNRSGRGLWKTIIDHPHYLWVGVVLVLGYALTIVFNCHRTQLYTPERDNSILQEQRLVLQACLTSGLLLAATLYLLHPGDPRTPIVVTTVGLTTVILSGRRLGFRILLHRSLKKGIGSRNVLIVGTGPTARALRNHLDNVRHLGYAFKGFIGLPAANGLDRSSDPAVIGTLDTIFDHVRRLFIDEIFFAAPCERDKVQQVLEEAREQDVNIRLVPDLYDSSVLSPPVEYLGQFPTIPLCRRRMPVSRLFVKRALDVAISLLTLVVLAPGFLVIAILIKRDSPGPVLYVSDRLGKKGRVFRCIKFRTMVQGADALRSTLHSKNQRDAILFKVADDPRITRLGRFLRKYSLDELPQFINVLRGEMSVVGPRPPLAGEVRQYKPPHLRRLEVPPGITGLWQVQARKDPSFDKYVSLDMAYIENWSIRLDIDIMLRTVGVVIAGTGS